MIYQKEEFVEEGSDEDKFPVKRIERWQPVYEEGEEKFIGSVALGVRTPSGVQQLPVDFEIDAEDLEEAFEKFEAAANPKVEEMRSRLQEQMQKARQQSSQNIVTPDQAGMGGGGEQGGPIDINDLRADNK
ncbi:MAG: hypothetical protein V5A84_02065 [Planctomycetota bacterium]